ncbi:MAG: hypothetical protein ABDH37_03730 [Candidatus Hydrothermales bacterium]
MIFFIFLTFSQDSLLYSPNVRGFFYLTESKRISIAEKKNWTFIVLTCYPHYLNSDIYYIFRSPTTSFTDTPIKILEDPPASRPPYDGSPSLVIDSSSNFKIHIFWNSERSMSGYPFWWQTEIFYTYSVGTYINFPAIENVSKDTNSFDLFPSATCDLSNKIYVVYWKIFMDKESIYLAERDNFGNWHNRKITEDEEIAENPLITTLDNNDKLIFYYEVLSQKLYARKLKDNYISEPFEISKGHDYAVTFKNNEIYFLYINKDSLYLKILDYNLISKRKVHLDFGQGLFIKNPSLIFLKDTLYIFYVKGNNTHSDIFSITFKGNILKKEIFVSSVGKNENPIPLITSEGEFFVFFQSDRRKYLEENIREFNHIYFKKRYFQNVTKKKNYITFLLPKDLEKKVIFDLSGRKTKSTSKKGIFFIKDKNGETLKCISF